MRWLILLALIGLTSCATASPEPRIVVREVRIPVPVSCVPDTYPAAPPQPDTDEALRAAPGAAERYLLLAAGRGVRIERQRQSDIVIEGCRTPAVRNGDTR